MKDPKGNIVFEDGWRAEFVKSLGKGYKNDAMQLLSTGITAEDAKFVKPVLIPASQLTAYYAKMGLTLDLTGMDENAGVIVLAVDRAHWFEFMEKMGHTGGAQAFADMQDQYAPGTLLNDMKGASYLPLDPGKPLDYELVTHELFHPADHLVNKLPHGSITDQAALQFIQGEVVRELKAHTTGAPVDNAESREKFQKAYHQKGILHDPANDEHTFQIWLKKQSVEYWEKTVRNLYAGYLPDWVENKFKMTGSRADRIKKGAQAIIKELSDSVLDLVHDNISMPEIFAVFNHFTDQDIVTQIKELTEAHGTAKTALFAKRSAGERLPQYSALPLSQTPPAAGAGAPPPPKPSVNTAPWAPTPGQAPIIPPASVVQTTNPSANTSTTSPVLTPAEQDLADLVKFIAGGQVSQAELLDMFENIVKPQFPDGDARMAAVRLQIDSLPPARSEARNGEAPARSESRDKKEVIAQLDKCLKQAQGRVNGLSFIPAAKLPESFTDNKAFDNHQLALTDEGKNRIEFNRTKYYDDVAAAMDIPDLAQREVMIEGIIEDLAVVVAHERVHGAGKDEAAAYAAMADAMQTLDAERYAWQIRFIRTMLEIRAGRIVTQDKHAREILEDAALQIIGGTGATKLPEKLLVSSISGEVIIFNNEDFGKRLGGTSVPTLALLEARVRKSLNPQHTVIGVRRSDLEGNDKLRDALIALHKKGVSIAVYSDDKEGKGTPEEGAFLVTVAALTATSLAQLVGTLPTTKETKEFINVQSALAMKALQVIIGEIVAQQEISVAA